jgi:cytochrome c-type biogenesis protein CcmH/NrfF
MATLIPLAHAGHWLWLLYVPPVLVVVISIIRTTRAERRAERHEREGGDEDAAGQPDHREPSA